MNTSTADQKEFDMSSSSTMIPATHHRLPALAVLSAMQKCIRRAMEKEAMEFAVELIHTSKAFTSMVCNRLEIISHEDIDCVANPQIVPFVFACTTQARQWYDKNKIGKCRMPIGNAIRVMSRAQKSREGDHFAASIGLANLLEDFTPEIPDWAYDHHTAKGKRLGRGLEFFRKESTRLVPKPRAVDHYEDEAYRLWAMKQSLLTDAEE